MSAPSEFHKRFRAQDDGSSSTPAVFSVVQQIHQLFAGTVAELSADEMLRLEETLQQGIDAAVSARQMKDSEMWEVAELAHCDNIDAMRFFNILLNDNSIPGNVRTILERAQKQVKFAQHLLNTSPAERPEITDEDKDYAEVYKMWADDKYNNLFSWWSHQFADRVWTDDVVRDYVWQRHTKIIPDEFMFLEGHIKNAFFRELSCDGVSAIVKPRRAILHTETNNEIGYEMIRKVERGVYLKVGYGDNFDGQYGWTVTAIQVS